MSDAKSDLRAEVARLQSELTFMRQYALQLCLQLDASQSKLSEVRMELLRCAMSKKGKFLINLESDAAP